MMIVNKIRSLFNPEQYQGWGKRSKYFEGWYYKVVEPEKKHAFAIIPGIAMDAAGNSHAFIQVLDGSLHTSSYHSFKSESFIPVSGKLDITIGDNHFTLNKLKVDLPGLKGTLTFTDTVPWPKTFYSPGIMGPYSFVPFMECYHGIVSMDHRLEGFLETESGKIDFTGGRGYIEKDWGRSFPSAYVWMQSNHFSHPGISFKASVAKIPWIGSSFTGFIAGLWLGDRLIRFTTYNGTRLVRLSISLEQVNLILKNRRNVLEVTALREKTAQLASPLRGFMEGRIEESMAGKIRIVLRDKKTGKVLFEDTSHRAGLEVAGKIKEILTDSDNH